MNYSILIYAKNIIQEKLNKSKLTNISLDKTVYISFSHSLRLLKSTQVHTDFFYLYIKDLIFRFCHILLSIPM